MKKLFFAALALTAMVACSKDDVPTDDVLTSSKKSVTISIANMASGTRADYTGGSTTQGDEVPVTAIDNNFHILFLDAGNKIQHVVTADEHDGLDDFETATPGSYTFHALPDYITKVAAVGNLTTAPTVGTVFNDALINGWKTESAATVAAEFNTLIAYAEADGLERTGSETCTDPHGDPYPLYRATINVNPIMARIEVTSISCTDFGEANVGYDAIGVTSMRLTGGTNSYSRDLGTFADNDAVESGNTSSCVLKTTSDELTAGTGKVWSWNILPQAKSNLVTSLYVSGNGYTTVAPERTVTITSYIDTNTSNEITNFEAGKIYRFAIPFSHTNLDPANGIICANVEVIIADWVVVNTGVGFATIP